MVDGGYADNTGLGMLLSLWPRLERLIAQHNATPGNATIVPVLLEVDNHYAQVAAPAEPGRTVEMLVPPSTKDRPDKLDDRAMEAQAAGTFTGALPGSKQECDIAPANGRFARIGPRTSPGLPAPLAWTLSRLATDDLTEQTTVFECFAAIKDNGDGTMSGYTYNATMNWSSGWAWSSLAAKACSCRSTTIPRPR